MSASNIHTQLDQLIVAWESEVVEFKRAGDGFSTSEIGKYFSALANEANLRGCEQGWLVFGVDNKSRCVIDTSYRKDKERLHGLKHQISQAPIHLTRSIAANIGLR